ncbi:MAG: carboxypeptidase M32 [Candidatus Bathyarchaeota archaeon]|nr:carboxypeptidase M32 [Candidatus Bathyarchaeota archaeon]
MDVSYLFMKEAIELINMSKTIEALESDYGKLMGLTKEIITLGSAASIIYWDMETMMPPKGVNLRSQQLGVLRQMMHRLSTKPEIGTLLSNIENHPDFESMDELQKRNMYLIRKHYDEQTKLPEKLVADIAKQEAIGVDVWKKAKAAKDFSLFKPELEKTLELKRQAAEILMEVKGTKTPYDALIDIYEPKMAADSISTIFSGLRDGLVEILQKCQNAPNQPNPEVLKRKVSITDQRKISKELAAFIGYDITSKEAGGRIDEVEHPFSTGYYDDVRITTHYYETNMASSLFSVLHEGGHAIYEQNLKQEWMFQPVGSSASLGFHESQSRFVENIIGRSREFWAYFYPKLNELIGNAFSDLSLDDFVRAINHVRPSKIRVEADEVTYCLHIIIRFEIEQDLVPNRIMVKDLPEIWNQKYKDYLGLDIENDSEGVMQDVHWAGGDFGYFPTYALGNILSGQLLNTMQKSVSDWKEQISRGNFQNVKKWLAENVHQQGDLYDPPALIKKITGEQMNSKPYLEYLNKKCSWVYGY